MNKPLRIKVIAEVGRETETAVDYVIRRVGARSARFFQRQFDGIGRTITTAMEKSFGQIERRLGTMGRLAGREIQGLARHFRGINQQLEQTVRLMSRVSGFGGPGGMGRSFAPRMPSHPGGFGSSAFRAGSAYSGPFARSYRSAGGGVDLGGMPLNQFAKAVQAMANRSSVGFGDNKVFISDVYQAARRVSPNLSSDAFKRRLVQAQQAGHLKLSRADLVSAMHPNDVGASQTQHLNAQWHMLLAAKRNRTWRGPSGQASSGGAFVPPDYAAMAAAAGLGSRSPSHGGPFFAASGRSGIGGSFRGGSGMGVGGGGYPPSGGWGAGGGGGGGRGRLSDAGIRARALLRNDELRRLQGVDRAIRRNNPRGIEGIIRSQDVRDPGLESAVDRIVGSMFSQDARRHQSYQLRSQVNARRQELRQFMAENRRMAREAARANEAEIGRFRPRDSALVGNVNDLVDSMFRQDAGTNANRTATEAARRKLDAQRSRALYQQFQSQQRAQAKELAAQQRAAAKLDSARSRALYKEFQQTERAAQISQSNAAHQEYLGTSGFKFSSARQVMGPGGARTVNQYTRSAGFFRPGGTATWDQSRGQLTTNIKELPSLWQRFAGLVKKDGSILGGVLSRAFSVGLHPLRTMGRIWSSIGSNAIRLSAIFYSVERLFRGIRALTWGPVERILEATDAQRTYSRSVAGVSGGFGRANALDEALWRKTATEPLTREEMREASRQMSTVAYLAPSMAMNDTSKVATQTVDYAKLLSGLQALNPDRTIQQVSVSTREALAGDLVSLRRALEVPLDLLVQLAGKNTQRDLAGDPAAVLKGLTEYKRLFAPNEVVSERANTYGFQKQRASELADRVMEVIGNSGLYERVVSRIKGGLDGIYQYVNSSSFAQRAQSIGKNIGDILSNLGNAFIVFVQKLSGAESISGVPEAIAIAVDTATHKLAEWTQNWQGFTGSLGDGMRSITGTLSAFVDSTVEGAQRLRDAGKVMGVADIQLDMAKRREAVDTLLNKAGAGGLRTKVGARSIWDYPAAAKNDPWFARKIGGSDEVLGALGAVGTWMTSDRSMRDIKGDYAKFNEYSYASPEAKAKIARVEELLDRQTLEYTSGGRPLANFANQSSAIKLLEQEGLLGPLKEMSGKLNTGPSFDIIGFMQKIVPAMMAGGQSLFSKTFSPATLMRYGQIPEGLRTGDPSKQSNPFSAMFLGFQNSIGSVGDSYSPEQADELFKLTTQARNSLSGIMGPGANYRLSDNPLEKAGDLLSKIRERRDQEIQGLEQMIGDFVLEMNEKPWMAHDAGRHINGLQSGIDYTRQAFDQQETLARSGLLKAGTRFGLGAIRNLGGESPATQAAVLRQVMAGRFDIQNLIGDTMGVSDRASAMGLGAFPAFERPKAMRQLLDANLGLSQQSAAYGNLSPVQTAEKQLEIYRQMLPTVTKLRTEASQAYAKDDSLDNLRVLNETNLLYEQMFNTLRDGWKEQSSGIRTLISETDELTASSQEYVLSLKLAGVTLGAVARQAIQQSKARRHQQQFEEIEKYGKTSFGDSPDAIRAAYAGRPFGRRAREMYRDSLANLHVPGLGLSYEKALGEYRANPTEENRLAADGAYKVFRDKNHELQQLRNELNLARESFLQFGESARVALEGSVGHAIANLIKGTGTLRDALLSFTDEIINAFAKMSAANIVQGLLGDAGTRDREGNPGDFGGLLGNILTTVFNNGGGAQSARNTAKGGLFPARPGGTLLRVGEAGHDELVTPVSRNSFGLNGPRPMPSAAFGGGGSVKVNLVQYTYETKAEAEAAKARLQGGGVSRGEVTELAKAAIASDFKSGGPLRKSLGR